jgi:hypothetical protein
VTKTITLYTGSGDSGDQAESQLKSWSQAEPMIRLERRSIHDDPAAVIRLGISSLPALVIGGEVVAQGALEQWLTDEFLAMLADRLAD